MLQCWIVTNLQGKPNACFSSKSEAYQFIGDYSECYAPQPIEGIAMSVEDYEGYREMDGGMMPPIDNLDF